jgi:murein DD-endopeptidase MepM/ murein hydrolase activator NlpD
MSVYDPPLEKGARGKAVRGAQWLLSGNNRQKIKTYTGKVDGHYGPATAKAAERMKHLLGYPSEAINGGFGLKLYSYLVPWGHKQARIRPASYVARGNQRRDAERRPKRAYPIKGRRGSLVGFPYQGTHRLGNWQSDRAYDIAVPTGSVIVALRSGVIGSKWGSLGKGGRFAGNRMYLICDDGQQYYLAHNGWQLEPGRRVRAGDEIARSNFPGLPHLHIGCRFGNPAFEILGGGLVIRTLANTALGLLSPPYALDAHPHDADQLVPAEDLEDNDVGGDGEPLEDAA